MLGFGLCPAVSSQDTELDHLLVTTVKATFDSHILRGPSLLYKREVQQSTSPYWLLYHLGLDGLINDLQEPPGLCSSSSRYWYGYSLL